MDRTSTPTHLVCFCSFSWLCCYGRRLHNNISKPYIIWKQSNDKSNKQALPWVLSTGVNCMVWIVTSLSNPIFVSSFLLGKYRLWLSSKRVAVYQAKLLQNKALFNSLTPNILLLTLPSSWYTLPCQLVTRIWC